MQNQEGALGKYLDEMRWQHRDGRRVLSMSKMSIEAGLSINTARSIISGGVTPTPQTIRLFCDRWGTEADYRQLMILAGYLVPSAMLEDDLEWQELRRIYAAATPENRKRIRERARELIDEQDAVQRDECQRTVRPATSET